MAILFDWYELPEPKDKQREEKVLHPRIRLNGSTTTGDLRRRIQQRCSLTETDVSAVLDALSDMMGEDLSEGRQVHLDGIGYFCPVLTTTEPVTASTKRKTTKIKLKGIKFRSDQTLKNNIGAIKAKPLKLNEHSSKLSDEEIDRRLARYFSAQQFMTRSDFQSLCGMMRSTAQLHLRRLRDEGKLENVGKLTQPIYVLKAGDDTVKQHVKE